MARHWVFLYRLHNILSVFLSSNKLGTWKPLTAKNTQQTLLQGFLASIAWRNSLKKSFRTEQLQHRVLVKHLEHTDVNWSDLQILNCQSTAADLKPLFIIFYFVFRYCVDSLENGDFSSGNLFIISHVWIFCNTKRLFARYYW